MTTPRFKRGAVKTTTQGDTRTVDTAKDRLSGPRYGGGAPVRRSFLVDEDWGGTSGRGSSGQHEEGAVEGDVPPGRVGRTRTTGTSGGIGATEDAPRVKGRRG